MRFERDTDGSSAKHHNQTGCPGGTLVMLPAFHKSLETLGGIQAVEFKGVSGDGWDQYVVQHARGQSSWKLVVDDRGIIVGALWHEGA